MKKLIYSVILITFISACSAKKESQTSEVKEPEVVEEAVRVQEIDMSRSPIEYDSKNGVLILEDGTVIEVAEGEHYNPDLEMPPHLRMELSLKKIDHTPKDFRAANAGENVEKIEKGEVIDGKKEGPFEIYYTNGFYEQGMYINNKREGVWLLFNRDSENIRIDIYQNGNWENYEIIREFE